MNFKAILGDVLKVTVGVAVYFVVVKPMLDKAKIGA